MISIKSIYLYIYWWVNHNLGKSPIWYISIYPSNYGHPSYTSARQRPWLRPPSSSSRPAPSAVHVQPLRGLGGKASTERWKEPGKWEKTWENLGESTKRYGHLGRIRPELDSRRMSTAWSVTMYRWLDESCSLWWRFLRFLSTDRSKPPKQRQNQIRLSHTLMTLIWKYPLKGGMAGMVIQVGLDLLLDGSILVAQKSPWDGPPSWLLSFWKCENLPILISLTYHQCSHVCSLGVYHGNGILTMVYCLSFWHINSSLPSIILNITSQTHTNFAIDYRL